MAVPNYIRQLRKAHGISGPELALSLGVSQATLSRWEAGQREVSDDFKQAVANHFNLPVQAIFYFGYDPLRDALMRTMDALSVMRDRVDSVERKLDAFEKAS